MENGKNFEAPVLTKREPTKMKTPHCQKCSRLVDSWMYHMTGHTDYTPILTLTCHGTTQTFGSSQAFAPEFRTEMKERFLSGRELMIWYANGTYNGPTESPNPSQPADSDHGTVSGTDTGSVQDQAPRVSRDEPDLSF